MVPSSQAPYVFKAVEVHRSVLLAQRCPWYKDTAGNQFLLGVSQHLADHGAVSTEADHH